MYENTYAVSCNFSIGAIYNCSYFRKNLMLLHEKNNIDKNLFAMHQKFIILHYLKTTYLNY